MWAISSKYKSVAVGLLILVAIIWIAVRACTPTAIEKAEMKLQEQKTLLKKNNEKNISMIYSFSEQTNNISGYKKVSMGLPILCNLLKSSSNFQLNKFFMLTSGLIEETTHKRISCVNNEVYHPYLDIISDSENISQEFFEQATIRLQCWKQ